VGRGEDTGHRRGGTRESETGVKVQTSHISYFSRLTDAQTFGDLALAETQRRGVERATHVCAVQDGAEWLQASSICTDLMRCAS
jgi:hypothetical protein